MRAPSQGMENRARRNGNVVTEHCRHPWSGSGKLEGCGRITPSGSWLFGVKLPGKPDADIWLPRKILRNSVAFTNRVLLVGKCLPMFRPRKSAGGRETLAETGPQRSQRVRFTIQVAQTGHPLSGVFPQATNGSKVVHDGEPLTFTARSEPFRLTGQLPGLARNRQYGGTCALSERA